MSALQDFRCGRRRWLGLAATGALAACASPSPALYTLASLPGTPLPGRPQVILVREISLPRYLVRPGIVRSAADYRIDVSANDWWGEPLAPMLGRVLTADLAERLPASTVLAESVALTVNPDLSVEVSIERFDKDGSGAVVLAGAVALRGPRGVPAPHTFHTSVMPATPDIAGQVAAMSRALAEFADLIAGLIAGRPHAA